MKSFNEKFCPIIGDTMKTLCLVILNQYSCFCLDTPQDNFKFVNYLADAWYALGAIVQFLRDAPTIALLGPPHHEKQPA